MGISEPMQRAHNAWGSEDSWREQTHPRAKTALRTEKVWPKRRPTMPSQAALVGFVRLAPVEFNREPVVVLQPLKKPFYPHRIETFKLRGDAKLHEKTSYRGAVCTTERGTRAGG